MVYWLDIIRYEENMMPIKLDRDILFYVKYIFKYIQIHEQLN